MKTPIPDAAHSPELTQAMIDFYRSATKLKEPVRVFGFSLGIRSETLVSHISSFIQIAVMMGCLYKILSKLNSSNITGDKTTFYSTEPKTKLEDIKGEIPKDLQIIIKKLKNPEVFAKNKGEIIRNILFYGPPGTAKTSRAQALAHELGCTFVPFKSTDFATGLVGGASRTVNALFGAARKCKPKDYDPKKQKPYCIVFLDEIDALGQNRNQLTSSHAQENPLTPLLTELDKEEENAGLIVIGATNLRESLDPALKRRFNEAQIEIGLPNKKDLLMIAKHYTVYRDVVTLNNGKMETDLPAHVALRKQHFVGGIPVNDPVIRQWKPVRKGRQLIHDAAPNNFLNKSLACTSQARFMQSAFDGNQIFSNEIAVLEPDFSSWRPYYLYPSSKQHGIYAPAVNDFKGINFHIDRMHQEKFSGNDVRLTVKKARDLAILHERRIKQKDFDDALSVQIKAKHSSPHGEMSEDVRNSMYI